MKKRIAILLTLVLCLLLASCGKPADAPTQTAADAQTTAEAQTSSASETTTDETTADETDAPSTEAVTAAPSTEAAADAQTGTQWIDAYKTYLLGQISSGESWDESSFGLYYIDGDNTPELVVSRGDFHGSGATITTYDRGKLTTTDEVGSWGAFSYEEKTGAVVGDYMGSGATMTTVYRLSGGKLTLLWSGEVYDSSFNGEDGIKYFSNEKTISKAEYDRLYAQYVPLMLDTIRTPNYGEDGGVMPLLTKENVELYFAALKDPGKLVSLRTETTRMTLSGTIAVEQDENGGDVFNLTLDKPFAASVQNRRFPYIVHTVRCIRDDGSGYRDGQRAEVKGIVTCDVDQQIVYIAPTP